jgi:hypothetical protein
VPFLLAERAIKTCSPGTRARLDALGVGRVRMLRAKGDCLVRLKGEDMRIYGRSGKKIFLAYFSYHMLLCNHGLSNGFKATLLHQVQ